MNKIIITLIFNCLLIGSTQAQFGRRILKKDQSSDSFVKLVYRTMNDSTGSGFGFPNPTSNKSIVFSKERPKGDKTRDWEELKIKYAELYYNKLVMQTRSTINVKYSTEKKFLTDTLRIYNISKIKDFGVGGGLRALRYENKTVRLFEDIVWEGYYVPSKLVLLQKKESDPYKSETFVLNYNNHKAFKRSAKRIFKDCPELLKRIDEGAYFPKYGYNLKKLANDYESMCLKN